MPQSSLRQSSCRRLLAIHSFDVGHLHGKFGSLFNRRKVKWPKNPLDFALQPLKYSAHDSVVSFQTRFIALSMSLHIFINFVGRQKRQVFCYIPRKRLFFLDVQIK